MNERKYNTILSILVIGFLALLVYSTCFKDSSWLKGDPTGAAKESVSDVSREEKHKKNKKTESSDDTAQSPEDASEAATEPEEPPVEGSEYLAFGDSLTYGQLSPAGIDKTGRNQVKKASRIPVCIGESIGLSVANFGRNGQGFYLNDACSVTAIDEIKSHDITNAALITISWGLNDSAHKLGSADDASGSDSICGRLKEVIEYTLSNTDHAQIILIGLTPAPSFDTQMQAGWTVGEANEMYRQVAAQYNLPFIDWAGCAVTQDFSEYSSDSVHPDSAGAYAQMGSYMAGMVSEVYIR